MPSIPHELSRIDACTIFTQGELTRELAIRHDILRGEIGRLESHDVLSRTVDELVEYYRARHHVNPIVLGTPEIELIEGEVDGRFCEDTRSVDPGRRVPIRGVCVRVHIPCGGETTLLRYRPPMNSGVLVEGKLDNGAIVIEHTYRNPPNDQAVNRWIAASVRGVQAMLDRGSRSISQYNDAVVSIARVTITALRTRALALQHLQASLPYPLYHRPMSQP